MNGDGFSISGPDSGVEMSLSWIQTLSAVIPGLDFGQEMFCYSKLPTGFTSLQTHIPLIFSHLLVEFFNQSERTTVARRR